MNEELEKIIKRLETSNEKADELIKLGEKILSAPSTKASETSTAIEKKDKPDA